LKAGIVNCFNQLKILPFLIITLIFSFLISGCTKESTTNLVICNSDDYSQYPAVVGQILPSFTIEKAENRAYSSVDDGAIAEAFDMQAIGAIEKGIAKYWYPQYLATVVIAIDRDQTDAVVTSWNDLFATQQEVAFFDSPGNVQMLTAAMAYGLEGADYSLTSATRLLASLHDNGRLKINSFQSPIIICYDYQAAALIEDGRKFEIIIPSEGTFTYQKGLLSNEKLNFEGNVDNLLLEAKLRLLNEQSDLSIYPDKAAYVSAVAVIDYEHFVKITQNVTRLIERNVLDSKSFMTIDNQEHLYFALIYIILVTIWAASAVRRSMQKGISYSAFFTGIILIGWTLVRLIKYQVVDVPVLARYLWYAYYIFQLSLPLLLLWMAWAIDKPEKETVPPKWWQIMAGLVGILILLVFTNDLHGLVFQLDLNKPDWDINYSYGLGYYLVLFVSMANLVAVFVMLLLKSIRNPRKKGFIFPIAFFVMFSSYTYSYIVRNPLVYQTDITIVTGLFTMLMLESGMRSGLIPVNTKYIDLFIRSPLKMQIINQKGELAMASASAAPLNKELLNKVLSSSPAPILQDDDSLLSANPIPGGYAIWQDDISKLTKLNREIQESTQMLTEANAMLAEEEKLKRIISEENAKKQLMEQLEAEIAESTEKLSTMIEILPHSENQSKETTRIALLLCYIKRRCNLFFREKETNAIGTDELIVYIVEFSEITKHSNVQIATVNEINGSLAVRHATLFYDFLHVLLDLAVQKGCRYVIVNLETQEESVTMRVLPSEDIGPFKPTGAFFSAITTAMGNIVTKDLEDTIGISLSFPNWAPSDD